jgi:hypothetical protein
LCDEIHELRSIADREKEVRSQKSGARRKKTVEKTGKALAGYC